MESGAWLILPLLSAASRPTARTRPGACGTRTAAAARADDGRHWVHPHPVVRVRIDHLITNSVSVLVDPPERLLKQTRLGVSLRNRALEDIQLVLMHRDIGKGTGLIGVVRQLDEMSFN